MSPVCFLYEEIRFSPPAVSGDSSDLTALLPLLSIYIYVYISGERVYRFVCIIIVEGDAFQTDEARISSRFFREDLFTRHDDRRNSAYEYDDQAILLLLLSVDALNDDKRLYFAMEN